VNLSVDGGGAPHANGPWDHGRCDDAFALPASPHTPVILTPRAVLPWAGPLVIDETGPIGFFGMLTCADTSAGRFPSWLGRANLSTSRPKRKHTPSPLLRTGRTGHPIAVATAVM
jgi:hypothetical protein